jgi:hypothetical protein
MRRPLLLLDRGFYQIAAGCLRPFGGLRAVE